MGILESKFTSDQGIMTLKHISYGNKVWMPVNHEKKISGHDDEHDDEKGHLYKGSALIGTRFVKSDNTALNNRSINI